MEEEIYKLEEKIKVSKMVSEMKKKEMDYYVKMSNFYVGIMITLLVGLLVGYYFFNFELTEVLSVIVILLVLNPLSSIRTKIVESFVFMNTENNNKIIYQDLIEVLKNKRNHSHEE